jgi:cell division control protein 24
VAYSIIQQRYAELAQGPLGGDVIHHLFPNLKQLLNFQRGFLIRFEGVAENPVNEQRWGVPFIERVSLSNMPSITFIEPLIGA